MSEENEEKPDDPCDDICKDIHRWITKPKDKEDESQTVYRNA